ncbi:MAG: glutamate dehydrogenase, partial [Gammaproteobacteria bacterium]|nr:glutamate dehydrogenase [Gammaproteobacteria bacterium]
ANYLRALEDVSGQEVPAKIRSQIVHGASELDLVRSGLDDTMRSAFSDIRDTIKHNPEIHDYRTAAFVIAIRKLAQSYYDLGLAEVRE